MPGCGMHSRPKLAEKAGYNSLYYNKVSNNNQPYELLDPLAGIISIKVVQRILTKMENVQVCVRVCARTDKLPLRRK